SLLQSRKVSLQVNAQVPWGLQLPLALSRWQVTPHAPQCSSFDSRFVSQPVVGSLSQSANPATHSPTISQLPAEQTESTLSSSHTIPRPPRFCLSVHRSVSQPVAD